MLPPALLARCLCVLLENTPPEFSSLQAVGMNFDKLSRLFMSTLAPAKTPYKLLISRVNISTLILVKKYSKYVTNRIKNVIF
jgi:hypothetical protein